MVRGIYLLAGGLALLIGLVGIVVPLLPTAVFLILAAACFARAEPRLEAWLLSHPRFGPPIVARREHGAIAPRAKIAALLTIGFGFAATLAVAMPPPALAGVIGVALAAVALFIASRPNPPAPTRR